MSVIAIVQSCYIPWKGYFDLIRQADQFVLYDCVQYTPRDWRNRNRIKTPQGTHWLTIPVHASRQNLICEVTCESDAWRANHWQTVRRAYARAPYFSLWEPQLEALWHQCEFSYLSEVNRHFLSGLCRMLEIATPLHLQTRQLIEQGDRTDKLIAICRHYGATHYLSGPSAKDYLDTEKFAEAGIAVRWMDYSPYREYPQLYPPFEHGVTMLDLLFNTGAQWRQYL